MRAALSFLRLAPVCGEGAAFVVPEALDEMIVHHARCLTKSVNDGRPAEMEAAGFELLGDADRERRLRRDFGHVAKGILHALAFEKPPHKGSKTFFLFNLKPCSRRSNRAFDLCPVTDNARI